VRDRTDNRFLPSSGDRITLSYEQFIGEWNFGRARMAYATHRTLDVDELDRKHILSWRADVGFNLGSAPIFEKFYAGGLGSIRGFEFRGVGPRGGLLERDPIGGDFSLTTSFEYTFPLYTDMLRGVLFTDMGTVEENFGLTQWRASVGFGVRMTIDLFGPLPIELDFAIPILKDPEDEGQVFSFYIGRVF
jgi:outer membrane protein insertion porin family